MVGAVMRAMDWSVSSNPRAVKVEEYKNRLPVEQVKLYEDLLLSLDSVAVCINASEWDIPEDGWYNATHLTKEASIEFTRKIVEF